MLLEQAGMVNFSIEPYCSTISLSIYLFGMLSSYLFGMLSSYLFGMIRLPSFRVVKSPASIHLKNKTKKPILNCWEDVEQKETKQKTTLMSKRR